MRIYKTKMNSDTNLRTLARTSMSGSHAKTCDSVDSHKFVGSHRCRGFTLIETMIATALFTVIMVIGTGAVLNTSTVHKKTQSTRAVIDTIHFIMEDMARNIRLGSSYKCPAITNNMTPEGFINADPTDCLPNIRSKTLAFEAVNGDSLLLGDQHIYTILPDNNGQTRIYKSIDGGNTYIPLTPLQVNIKSQFSGFVVTGSDPTDSEQPQVVIRLKGEVIFKDLTTEFSLQTTVSQRLRDTSQ